MKKHISIITGIATFMSLTAFTPISDTDGFYRIDGTQSTIEWSGSKFTGTTQAGTVNLISGGLQLSGGKISNGKFTIDMTSISCSSIENPDMNRKFVNHLKDDDFFSVGKFKTANLTIISADGDGNVKANLTIKGITHEVVFPSTLSVENNVLTATATIEVDRSKYDVRYGSDSFFDNLGDKAIDNIIKFNLILKGVAS